MTVPSDRKYTESHEWVLVQGDEVLVGITHDAVEQLGDMVYVGDVNVGDELSAGDTAAVVESVKAASDVYAPIAGEVIAFNEALEADPTLLNQDAYANWIFKLKAKDLAEVDGLMSADQYSAE